MWGEVWRGRGGAGRRKVLFITLAPSTHVVFVLFLVRERNSEAV